MNICPKCGLPEQACICQEITKEEQKISVDTEKRRFGKETTLVSGFNNSVDLKDIAKKLKSKLACGGTVKNKNIELQGNHMKNIKKALTDIGFKEDQISI